MPETTYYINPKYEKSVGWLGPGQPVDGGHYYPVVSGQEEQINGNTVLVDHTGGGSSADLYNLFPRESSVTTPTTSPATHGATGSASSTASADAAATVSIDAPLWMLTLLAALTALLILRKVL